MFFMLTWMMSLGSREWLRLVSNVQHFNGKWLGIQALRDDWWALIYSLPYFSFASIHTLMSRNIGACKHRENKTKVFSLRARILKTMMLVLQLALSKWSCLLLTCCVVPIYRKVVHLWSKEFYLVRELDCFSAKVLGTEVTDAPLPSLIFLQCTPSLSKVNRQ